jgi:hypothetical protein
VRKSSSSSDPRETKEAAQTGKASVGKDEPEKLVCKTKFIFKTKLVFKTKLNLTKLGPFG